VRVLIIDNIDSFVYNLYQYVGELGVEEVTVRRNRITPEEVRDLDPDRILLSPGPGRPERAGNSLEIVRALGREIPILGVCLGHQIIGVAYGGKVSRAPTLLHGKVSRIEHDGEGIYQGVENPFTATRYHSLAVLEEGLPRDLKVTARSQEDGVIMGIRHRRDPVEGIQFHPESILTHQGKRILQNFLGL
jgi:anthranilate synthase/aminodeoxychorismate synthase-like glutamine amidotransferase